MAQGFQPLPMHLHTSLFSPCSQTPYIRLYHASPPPSPSHSQAESQGYGPTQLYAQTQQEADPEVRTTSFSFPNECVLYLLSREMLEQADRKIWAGEGSWGLKGICVRHDKTKVDNQGGRPLQRRKESTPAPTPGCGSTGGIMPGWGSLIAYVCLYICMYVCIFEK